MDDKSLLALGSLSVLLETLCNQALQHTLVVALHSQPDFFYDLFGRNVAVSEGEENFAFRTVGEGYFFGFPNDSVIF